MIIGREFETVNLRLVVDSHKTPHISITAPLVDSRDMNVLNIIIYGQKGIGMDVGKTDELAKMLYLMNIRAKSVAVDYQIFDGKEGIQQVADSLAGALAKLYNGSETESVKRDTTEDNIASLD